MIVNNFEPCNLSVCAHIQKKASGIVHFSKISLNSELSEQFGLFFAQQQQSLPSTQPLKQKNKSQWFKIPQVINQVKSTKTLLFWLQSTANQGTLG